MSPSTRRRVAWLVFLTLCVVPAAGMAYLAYYVNRPAFPADIAERLEKRLGVPVQVGGVAFPRPGAVEYRNLVLRDHGERRPLASLGRLRIERDEHCWRWRATSLSLDLTAVGRDSLSPDREPTPSIAGRGGGQDVRETRLGADELAAAGRGPPLNRLLQALRPARGASLALTVSDLSIRLAQGQIELVDVEVRGFEDRRGRPCIQGHGRLRGVEMPRPAELEIRLADWQHPQVRELRLDSAGCALPLALAAPLADARPWVGPRARFQGRLRARETAEGLELQVQGRLTDLDLDALVGTQFPHHLSGRATCEIANLHWRTGQLESLRGTLEAGPGEIGGELLHALARAAGFIVHIEVPLHGRLPYQRMAFRFDVQGETLAVHGYADPSSDAVIVGPQGVLLHEPFAPGPVRGLVRALTWNPQDQSVMPARGESDWLKEVVNPDLSR